MGRQRENKQTHVCLLEIDPYEHGSRCRPAQCATCGWEATEAARRKEYIRRHGLKALKRQLRARKEKEGAEDHAESSTY